MDIVRATEETEPARSAPGMGDYPSATGLYAAIVTALYWREKTGQGGVVQSSRLCRKFCLGGRAGAVTAVCGRIRRPGSRTIRPQ